MRCFVFFFCWGLSSLAIAQSSQPVKEPVFVPPNPPKTRPVLVPESEGLRPELYILAQGWFDSAAGEDGSFLIRRAEIGVLGNIVPKRFRYTLVLDPSIALLTGLQEDPNNDLVLQNQNNALLQDLFLTLVITRTNELSVGQFRSPVSFEGYSLSRSLLFPERSIVSQNFGDELDIGARLEGWGKRFSYNLSIFNGAGQNTLDNDASKEIAARFEVYPYEGFLLGASGLATIFLQDGTEEKTRLGLDLRYERGLWLLQTEALIGTLGELSQAGVYVTGLVPFPLINNAQLGGRISFLANAPGETGIEETLTDQREITLGASYFLKENQAKIQASISFFQNSFLQEDLSPRVENQTQFILALQASR